MNLIKVAIGLTLTLLVGSPAAAAPTAYHWSRETSGPVVVTVYDQTADEPWGKALRRATDEWNAGTNGVEFMFSPEPANCDTGQGAFTLVICVHETEPGYQAQTNLYLKTGHITYATIWMGPRPSPPRNHLACHELGHAFGVLHRKPKERNTCMTNGNSIYAEHPDQKDFNGVTFHHSHVH